MVSHPISFPTLLESCPGPKLRWIELADSTGLVAWPQSPRGPLSTWIFTQRLPWLDRMAVARPLRPPQQTGEDEKILLEP